MKFLVMVSILASLSTKTIAGDFSAQTLADSTVQTAAYVVADLLGVSTRATSLGTTEAQKMAAKQIQSDIQAYEANGTMTLFLADKLNLVKSVDPDLSEAEMIDVLSLATISILK
jgi:hypothetical protein